MPAQHAKRPCVLLGNLEPMVRLGMSRVLGQEGVEVVAEEGGPPDVVAHVKRLHPDTVVLGMDGRTSSELGEQVRAAAPGTKVILWARDETEMQVFDPGSSSPRRIRTSVSGALKSEVGAGKPREEGR
jgi:DNA-binding NarL/FixJ family response regulator